MSNQENNNIVAVSGLPRWLADMYALSISDIMAYRRAYLAR